MAHEHVPGTHPARIPYHNWCPLNACTIYTPIEKLCPVCRGVEGRVLRVISEERERCAKIVEEFEGWKFTPHNPSARMDRGTSEVDTRLSMLELAKEIRES